MKMKTFFAIVLAIIAVFCSNAYSLSLSFDYSTIHTEAGINAGVIAKVENNSSEKACFEVYTYTNNEDIRAVPGIKELCLNPNERTEFSVAIMSDRHTEEGTYYAEVELVSNGIATAEDMEVVIDRTNGIEFRIPYDIEICKDKYTHEITIEVENLESQTKEIYLSAESMIFAPYFNESKIRVRGNSTQEVKLIVNTNETTKEGMYRFNIYARTDSEYLEREVSLEVKSCKNDEIEIIYLPSSLNLTKGSSRTIEAGIRNLTLEDKKVRLSMIGSLPSNLKHEIVIGPESTRYVSITISAREDENGGLHKMKFYAWTEEDAEEKEVKVYVGNEHSIGIEVLNEATIEACDISKGIISVKVSNKGDYNETITFSMESLPSGVSYAISDDEITLKKGESKVVYITLHASYGTSLGEKYAYFVARASGKNYKEKVKFRIAESKEPVEKKEGVLKIMHYPNSISVKKGDEVSIELSIYNGSDEVVVADIYADAPKGIYVFLPQVAIGAGESITVRGKIIAKAFADEGNYEIALKAESQNFIDVKIMSVKVSAAEVGNEQDEDGFLAGLVSLGFLTLGSGGAIIIIVAALILIIGYLLLKRDKTENNAWAYQGNGHDL